MIWIRPKAAYGDTAPMRESWGSDSGSSDRK